MANYWQMGRWMVCQILYLSQIGVQRAKNYSPNGIPEHKLKKMNLQEKWFLVKHIFNKMKGKNI